jgi:hypothetical protein
MSFFELLLQCFGGLQSFINKWYSISRVWETFFPVVPGKQEGVSGVSLNNVNCATIVINSLTPHRFA